MYQGSKWATFYGPARPKAARKFFEPARPGRAGLRSGPARPTKFGKPARLGPGPK